MTDQDELCPCGSGRKYKNCCMTQVRKGECKAFASEKFLILIKKESISYKIFQILFGNDGSIYINFPYCKVKQGICSLSTVKGDGRNQFDLDLKKGGKATTCLVKFSYHPDGNVHFSQTGKILPIIKKKATPFTSQDDHIFTIYIKGFSTFDSMDSSERLFRSPKTTNLIFDLGNSNSTAFKFVGRLFSPESLSKSIKLPNNSPRCIGLDPNGQQFIGFLLSLSLASKYRHYTLFLTIAENPLAEKELEHLTFMGGFDSNEIVNNYNKETSFLTLTYPIEHFDLLEKEIGSLDIR